MHRPTIACLALILSLAAAPSWAQATRTWVSGVGDDLNPCSRTAPCKTFAGAISKTAAAGEINAIDPGAFGAVTITKSISIVAEGGTAGVLATLGSNGVIVNTPNASDSVVLRGLDIEGAGTGANGIRFIGSGSLHVERTTIHGFAETGIVVAPTTATRLYVVDTVIRDNNPAGATNFGGIFINPGAGGSVEGSLERVRLLRNFNGLRVQGNARVTARECTASGNTGNGFLATFATNVQINLDRCEASTNAHGVRADGANAVIRIANTMITNNPGNGLFTNAGGVIQSFGNNNVAGNGTNGTPTATPGEM